MNIPGAYYMQLHQSKLTIGFRTAKQVEDWLASQGSLQWQASWEVKRVFAWGAFHYTATNEGWIVCRDDSEDTLGVPPGASQPEPKDFDPSHYEYIADNPANNENL